MTKRTQPTTQFKGFPGGIDNRAASYALPDGNCRDAVNLDIRKSGKYKRRTGYRKLALTTMAHSLFSNGSVTMFVDGDTLSLFFPDNTTAALVPLWGYDRTVYIDVAGEVFLSNGTYTARWKDNGLHNWGVEAPPCQPTCLPNTAGGMSGGDYQVAITWRDQAGIESSTPLVATVTVPDGGGISLINFPPPPGNIVSVAVYVSSVNGNQLYLAGDYPVSPSQSVVVEARSEVTPLVTQFAQPMPGVDYLAAVGGRIYGAKGNTLYRTRPYNYYLNDGLDGMLFEGDIRSLIPTHDGLYVVTESKAYFLAALESASPNRTDIANFGAVPGCSISDPVMPGGLWLSRKGLIRALPGGQIQNLTDEHVAMPIAEGGSMVIREADGERHAIISTWGATPNPLVSIDWATT